MKKSFYVLAITLIALFSFRSSNNLITQQSGCSEWTEYRSCGFVFYSCNSLYASAAEQHEFALEIHALHCKND